MNIDSNTQVFLGNTEIVEIKKGNDTIWQKSVTPQDNYFYIENKYNGTNTLTLTTTTTGSPSSSDYSSTVEYSKDKTNWTTITFDPTTPYNITMDIGEKVYFRNDSGKFNIFWSVSRYWTTTFTTSNDCFAGGDLRSILDYTNIGGVVSSRGCYAYLFKNNTSLINTQDIKIMSTDWNCCFSMFEGCSSLTTVHSDMLPATTLANQCYRNLFKNCTSLTIMPTLPATTMQSYSYGNMFEGCSSLTTVKKLPATTLASNCYYQMFKGCSSLTTVPSDMLPATTLANNCYEELFSGCYYLTTAPLLPATTLVTSCYQKLFYDCRSLNSVTVYANDISASSSHNQWVSGVSATGTFHNLGTASWPSGDNGVPSGWTVVTQ